MSAITNKEDSSENGCLKPGAIKLWRFVHHEDFQFRTKVFKDRKLQKNFLEIDGNLITVKGSFDNNRGYAWDGCTPKFNFLNLTWGTPDGKTVRHVNSITNKESYHPITYYASMVHDAIYQYKRCVPVTRKEADLIFREMLNEQKFVLKWPYYWAVRLFGWIFRGWRYSSHKQIVTGN